MRLFKSSLPGKREDCFFVIKELINYHFSVIKLTMIPKYSLSI